MSNAELAVSYAALILADDGVDITVRFSSLGILQKGWHMIGKVTDFYLTG